MTGILALAVGYAASVAAPPSGGALTVSVSPPSSDGAGGSGAPTPTVTTYVTGGSGSYSYAWSVDTLTFGTITINSPTNRTTNFTFTGLAFGEAGIATVRVDVLDLSTAEAGFALVDVTYSRSS